MLVWKSFLLILFATDNCLSVAMPNTKDKKDVEMSGNKTVDITLIKEKSINPIVEYRDEPLNSMHDYERISSYVIFYSSNNTNTKTYNIYA